MKEKIRSQLLENKRLQFEEGRGREALKNIAEKLEAELPGKFVEQEVEERIDNLKERYLKIGKKIDEVLKEENKDIEGFKKEVRNVIENEIKEDLILREIIKKKELSVTQDEIKSEFERIALDQGVDTAKVGLSEDLSRAIRSELYRSKAISILKENVIIDSGGD
jgi:trigger factor